jgi:opacity protein-like surface antigen
MIKGAVAVMAVLAAAIAGPAAAQSNEKGIFFGVSAGYSVYQSTCENLVVPCNDDGAAAKLFVGYRFNRYWAAELGAGALGRAEGSGVVPGFGPGTFEQKSYGGDLSALGSVPIVGGLSVFGRLGAYMTRTTVDQEIPGFLDQHDAKTQAGFTYGAGVAYQLGALGVRAEWQRYDNIGVPSFGKDDLDLFMLGVLVQF